VIKKNNMAPLENSLIKTEPFVDAFITDTFDPLTGASGATGKTHDWEISKKFVELSSKPVILAGGLNYQNVFDAILTVKPAGVDVHTSVENIDGKKDKYLLTKFLQQANKAFNIINGEK
jgi:phosphoribosylanthranilate isomerase